jgi:hypothetical protein
VHLKGKSWHHEDASIAMIDYLIERNDLMPFLRKEANFSERDILFIKELIAGERGWRYLHKATDCHVAAGNL